jgi:hypothetical protein
MAAAVAGVALLAALNRGTALAAATPMQPFSPMHGLEPNKGLSTPKKGFHFCSLQKAWWRIAAAVRRDGLQ